MSRRTRLWTWVGHVGTLALALLCGPSWADTYSPVWVVSADVGAPAGNPDAGAVVYAGLGGVLATGTYWNSWFQIADQSTVPGREDPLDSNGQTTGLRAYTYGLGADDWGGTGGANNGLNQDGVYNVGDADTPVTTIITLGAGAAASDRYTVAVYIAIPGYRSQPYTFTLGSDTRTATTIQNTGGATLEEGVNYVVFSNVAPQYAEPGDLLARFPFLNPAALPATYSGYYLAFETRDDLGDINSHVAGFQVALSAAATPLTLIEVGGAFAGGNVAREPNAVAFAKDLFLNGTHPNHTTNNLNNGTYGNSSSWIGNSEFSFAGVSLPGATRVSRVAFGRDNTGVVTDREQGTYALQYTTVPSPNETTPDADWAPLGLVHYDPADPDARLRHVYEFTPVLATGIRIIAPTGNAIDEIEVYRPPMTLSTVGGAFATNDARGGSAFASDIEGQSGGIPNQPTGYGGAHTTVGVNDGNYGNSGCWLAAAAGSFVGVSFGSTLTTIGQVAWGRDGTGADQYHADDRTVGTYTLQYTTVANPDNQTPAASWTTIGSVSYMGNGDVSPSTPNSLGRRHAWSFQPVQVTGLRLVMGQNKTAVDELEASSYAPPALTLTQVGGTLDTTQNIATAGTAFAKDVLGDGGYPAHQVSHVNNGTYGNTSSWIGNSWNSFVGVSLPAARKIHAVAFGRDNTGGFADRDEGIYLIQYTAVASPDASTPDASWTTLGAVCYDAEDARAHLRHLYEFPEVKATGVRIFATGNGMNNGQAIDELEIQSLPVVPIGTIIRIR